MRRILTVLAPAVALVLALAAPGAAFGHGARHHRHHHRVRGARLIKLTPVQGSKAAAEPGTPTAEGVGTVSSYEKEVLTIKLTDGSSLSGKVTAQTHVICVSSAPTSETSPTPTPGWDHGYGHFGSSVAVSARAASSVTRPIVENACICMASRPTVRSRWPFAREITIERSM